MYLLPPIPNVEDYSGSDRVLALCNVTNKICKRTDTAIAFTQEYSRVLCPWMNLNVSTLSTGSGSSKDTQAGVEKTEERTFYI